MDIDGRIGKRSQDRIFIDVLICFDINKYLKIIMDGTTKF